MIVSLDYFAKHAFYSRTFSIAAVQDARKIAGTYPTRVDHWNNVWSSINPTIKSRKSHE